MDLMLDLYRPKASKELPETLPAMVFVFGVGYKKGSRKVGYIRDLCEHYAKRGYVTAATSYRLLKHNLSARENSIPAPLEFSRSTRVVNASIQDTANSVRWLKENADDLKIDTTGIGLGGVSAGALNVTYVGHAEADLLGPNAEVAAVLCLMGVPDMDPNLIDASDPPTFFGHGQKDNPALIKPYLNQLNKVGVDNKLSLAPGLGRRIVPILTDSLKSLRRSGAFRSETRASVGASGCPQGQTVALGRKLLRRLVILRSMEKLSGIIVWISVFKRRSCPS